jgi:hypothetical protein
VVFICGVLSGATAARPGRLSCPCSASWPRRLSWPMGHAHDLLFSHERDTAAIAPGGHDRRRSLMRVRSRGRPVRRERFDALIVARTGWRWWTFTAVRMAVTRWFRRSTPTPLNRMLICCAPGRRSCGNAARQSESIVGYTQGSHVTIVNPGAAVVALPVSGTSAGSDYGRIRSGWIRVPPGDTVLDRCMSDGWGRFTRQPARRSRARPSRPTPAARSQCDDWACPACAAPWICDAGL